LGKVKLLSPIDKMKTCPTCKQTYTDSELYFCLNDGEMLSATNAEPPPTVFMDAPRVTNQNWQGTQQNTNFQNQQMMPNQQFNRPVMVVGQNQTFPILSLVLGIVGLLGSCCQGGIPLGAAAIICGFLGIKNINANPQQFGGNSLAIGGIVCGIIALSISIVMLILMIISDA
jgi:Domain of unknown function (DUF4190)